MESNINKALFTGIRIAGTVLIMLLVLYGTLRASLLAYDFGYRVFTEPAMEKVPGTAVVVTIEEDMEAMEIAEYLLEKRLIRDQYLFWLQYQLSAYKDELIPLLMNSNNVAQDLSIAALTKGIGLPGEHTSMVELKMTALDWGYMVICTLPFVGFLGGVL